MTTKNNELDIVFQILVNTILLSVKGGILLESGTLILIYSSKSGPHLL